MSLFGWMGTNGSTPFYMGVAGDLDDNQLKTYHDSYEVYVNGDYVGRKTLVCQGESINDVDRHLKESGFRDFKDEAIGGQFIIKTEDPQEARRIKQNLNIYLNIR